MEQPTPWVAAARAGELSAGEIEVWRLDLRQPRRVIELIFHGLIGAEQARAQRFRQASDYAAYVLTRGVLRQLLSAYLARAGRAVSPHAIVLTQGARGKPHMAGTPDFGALEFSVSHAGDYALLGFGRSGALGVDLERVETRRDVDLIVAHHFAPAEAAAFLEASKACSEDAKYRLFYRYWTRKEAYIKALGAGMSLDLQSFAVGLEPGAPMAWSARADAARWRFFAMNPDAAHIGAVCVMQGVRYLRTMTATVSNSASVQLDL